MVNFKAKQRANYDNLMPVLNSTSTLLADIVKRLETKRRMLKLNFAPTIFSYDGDTTLIWTDEKGFLRKKLL